MLLKFFSLKYLNILLLKSCVLLKGCSNSLTATFDLPIDADPGQWDINVESTIYGELTPLVNAFTISSSPDLDRDGLIDIVDFSFFINNWLTCNKCWY